MKVGGATTTVTFSQANFNTALAVYGGGSYTVNPESVARKWPCCWRSTLAASGACTGGREEDDPHGLVQQPDHWHYPDYWAARQHPARVQHRQHRPRAALLQMQKDTSISIAGQPLARRRGGAGLLRQQLCTGDRATQAHVAAGASVR